MPLVRIDLLRGRSRDELVAIGSCVQDAMVAEFNVPARDHFQILTEHDPEHLIFNRNYLDIDRTDSWVLVHITLSSGRGTAAKQAFYTRLSRALGTAVGLRSEDLAVALVENQREDWSFGHGEASYLTLAPEDWR